MHARKDGNPEYAFAFKMVISDQMAEAKVVDVIFKLNNLNARYHAYRTRVLNPP